MRGENAVRVRRNDAPQDWVEGYIVFNLDRLGWRTKLRETLNQIVALRWRHFILRLRREIIVQDRAIMINHQAIDYVMTITNGVFFGRSLGCMKVPPKADQDGQHNQDQNKTLTRQFRS